jgi:hypothetical protein
MTVINNADAVYLGGTAVDRVYLGSERVWPAFSPVELFANSEQGAWYDPSDISTLFQDAAGTTPVTADGDPVGRMLDQSENGNHASQAVSADRPVYEAGSVRESLAFNGNNSGLDTGVSKSIFEASWSVTLWCYFNDDSQGILVGTYDGSGVNLEKATNGRARIYYGSSTDLHTPDNAVKINEWNHCVFVRDVSSNTFKIYVDKILVSTFSRESTFPYGGLENMQLGRDYRTGSTALNGNIGNTVIVNKVLSQSEIDNLYDFG